MSDIYLWETFDRLGREALERNDFSQANEAFRSAVAAAEELESHDRLVLSLRNLAATLRAQGLAHDSYELLNRTLEVASEKLGDSHSQTIESHRDLSAACQELGFLDKADSHLKQILAHESLHAPPEELWYTLLELAKLATARERPHEAAHYFSRVVELKKRVLGEEHPEVAQALIWLSAAHQQSGQSEAAADMMESAMKAMESQFAGQPLYLAQSLMAASQMVEESGQLEQALAYRRRALDILAEHLTDDDPRLWDARELIANSLAGLGALEEATEMLEYCLANRPSLEPHRKGAIVKNLGGLYLSQGQLEKADENYQQAVTLLRNSLGPDHPAFLATQEERIQYLFFTGRAAEATELALSMLRATEDRFGPGHPNTAQVYSSTALLAYKSQRWDLSLQLMRAAEKIWLSLRPQPEDVLANCRINIASCLLSLDCLDEAEGTLLLAEEYAQASLRPLIVSLREQILSKKSEQKGSQMEPNEVPETENEVQKASEPLEHDDIFDIPEIDPQLEPTLRIPISDLFEQGPGAPTISTEGSEEPGSESASAEVDRQVEVEAEVNEAPVADEIEDPFADVHEPIARIEESGQEEPEEVSEPASEALPEQYELPDIDFLQRPAEEAVKDLEALALDDDGTEDVEPEVSSQEVQETQDAPELEAPAPVSSSTPREPEEFVERRKTPRASLALNKFFELKVTTQTGNEIDQVRSFFVDLGLGGFRVNSEKPLGLDSPLRVSLPAELLGEELDVPAQVVWQKALFGETYLQGLEFGELTQAQEHLLSKKIGVEQGNRNTRQHYRLYRPFPIKLSAGSGEGWMSCYATDLSLDGLGTRLKAPLECDCEVKVRLELDFELPTVEVEARVAWSKEGENGVTHGLQFASVGPVEAKTIKRYIDRCLEFSPD